MTLEHKSFPVAELKVVNEVQGIIEAIVSVFNNTDLGKEVVHPGFFTKSLQRKKPKGVWMHDWSTPVAKTLEARELMPGDPLLPPALKDLGGAYIKGQFNLDTQRGREGFSDIKFGIVDEFSIGYQVLEDEVKDGLRHLYEGDWYEWSPVLVGMNPATALISAKAAPNVTVNVTVDAETTTSGTEASPTVETKGKFEDAIAEEVNSLYNLSNTLQRVTWQCQMMQEIAQEAGLPYDLETELRAVLDEFSARWIAAVAGGDSTDDEGADGLVLAIGTKTLLPAGMTFAAHTEAVHATVTEFATRTKALLDIRAKEGRKISKERRELIKQCAELLMQLYEESEPPAKDDDQKALEAEVAAILREHYNRAPRIRALQRSIR